ncbi:hypothetical protein L596_025674 [Steinernema carpocapsae]|uniref:Uncharacterized protein n=1 Tax=Steinernema carpocapsae TaxID=34508 RepID=A0A4U5M8I1_STECR|nr:hypothetical protein L596_025674 [Steinernema carpocapsae]
MTPPVHASFERLRCDVHHRYASRVTATAFAATRSGSRSRGEFIASNSKVPPSTSTDNWRNRPSSKADYRWYGAFIVVPNMMTFVIAFTKRGHVLLTYNNELVELRFDVEHDESTDADGKKKVSPQSSVALESFYVCNAADITCELRGSIDGSIDLLSATVLGDVLVVGNSSINITTGEKAFIDPELGYSIGEIFDLATGQAYGTTSEKNSRLIGVIRGKKIYAEPCGGGNRTVIKSVTYGCYGGDCSKRHRTLHLDSSVLNCFILDGCEIAYGPETIFPSVAVIPKTPISKYEINFTSTPSTPITTSSTSPPITTTPEPPPRYFVLKTPPGYKKREERLAQNEEEDEDEYEDDEEEFDITEWYLTIFATFSVMSSRVFGLP